MLGLSLFKKGEELERGMKSLRVKLTYWGDIKHLVNKFLTEHSISNESAVKKYKSPLEHCDPTYAYYFETQETFKISF